MCDRAAPVESTETNNETQRHGRGRHRRRLGRA
ncbi:hypothetical protein, partial [Burkholderia pseudomallei]